MGSQQQIIANRLPATLQRSFMRFHRKSCVAADCEALRTGRTTAMLAKPLENARRFLKYPVTALLFVIGIRGVQSWYPTAARTVEIGY
jgi:hypothetical protein